LEENGEYGKIEKVFIRKVLDSRGNETVEVDVHTDVGFGRCSAPSGASTGKHEVVSIPSIGVDKAIANYRENVLPRLIGMFSSRQAEIDNLLHELDGTDNFSNLGGNLAVASSLAAAKAAASSLDVPLYEHIAMGRDYGMPHPFGNVIGGGRHAIGGTDIQEFMSVSFGKKVSDSIFSNAIVHKRIKEKLVKKRPRDAIGKGDEGAWVAKLGNHDAMDILAEACVEVTKEYGIKCLPALDLAASELFRNGRYHYKEGSVSTEKQIEFIADLVEEYGLYSVEDPLDEEDFEGYARLTSLIGDRCLVIGDDLFVTNVKRLGRGIEMKSANSILIKPNQIGTLTDVIETVKLAHETGYRTVISHRSGETTDETIAHLAVALGCHGIKTGAVGGERLAKLNELIRIEEELIRRSEA
jgi:enolase